MGEVGKHYRDLIDETYNLLSSDIVKYIDKDKMLIFTANGVKYNNIETFDDPPYVEYLIGEYTTIVLRRPNDQMIGDEYANIQLIDYTDKILSVPIPFCEDISYEEFIAILVKNKLLIDIEECI